MSANSIEQVIEKLGGIIEQSKDAMSPTGYFPALYKKVTEKVRDGIADRYFDDNDRMEELDVVFANRYLAAYDAYRSGEDCSSSWKLAFDATKHRQKIVIQHLFLGMNAHINLDLGIAAAQVAPGKHLAALEGDFMKINKVLASLVNGVQDELGQIWPMMKVLDWLGGKLDEGLADFSMEIARKSAWRVAKAAADLSGNDLQQYIFQKDDKVHRFGHMVSNPGWLLSAFVRAIRTSEQGTVKRKIEVLEGCNS